MSVRLLPLFLSATLLVACGGATKKAENPESAASESGEERSGTDVDEPEAKAEPADETPPYSGPDPRDVLLRDEAVFVVNFQESDQGKKKIEACEKKSGGNPEKRAKCISALMKKVTREGFGFEKDAEGVLHYVRFGVENQRKVVYNHVECKMGEPDGAKVTITTSGKDTARRRKGTVPAQFTLEVVDEFTVVSKDPSRGRVVYETRLGMFSQEQL